MTAARPILEDELHAYVDQVLVQDRAAEVEAYLAANPAVAERVRGFSAHRALLRAHLAPVLAEPVPSELNLARIVQNRRKPGISGWRGAVAARALLALGATAGWFGHDSIRPEPGGIVALASAAAANYVVYAPDQLRPVEVRAGGPEPLTSWMTARLGRPVEPPDLSSAGYRLMEGRVVATDRGAAGLFMYDDDHGSRIILLNKTMAVAEKNAVLTSGTVGQVATWSWARNGIGYSLAGQNTTDDLRDVADRVRHLAEKGA